MKTELQRDWVEIVDILYVLAKDILYCPYPYLMVVEEKKGDKSCFSGSSEKENPIHIEGEQHKSISLAPSTISESMMVKQECYEHSSDDDSATFRTPPSSPTPTNKHDRSLPVVLTAEDDTENLLQSQTHIPELKDLDLTKIITDEHDGALAEYYDTENLLQSQTHFAAPELKDLDLIKLVNWQGVGLQLGIEDYELQKIRLNYQQHDDHKREMFRAWLRTCANPNYHDLIKALEAVGESMAVQQIREKFVNN